MGTGPKLNKEQRTLLAEFARDKRVSGKWSHARIADEFERLHGLRVDRSTVTRALNRVDKNAKERIQSLAIQEIFEAADTFDKVIELAFDAFLYVPDIAKGKMPEDEPFLKSPAWLTVIITAQQAKLKALGADVQKIELTGKDGGPVAMDDARSKLARLIASHAAATGAGGVAGQPNG